MDVPYYGYLMTAHFAHGRSQFICANKHFKYVLGTSGSKYEFLFYFMEGQCGTHYLDHRERYSVHQVNVCIVQLLYSLHYTTHHEH